jgi:hypothetical protein
MTRRAVLAGWVLGTAAVAWGVHDTNARGGAAGGADLLAMAGGAGIVLAAAARAAGEEQAPPPGDGAQQEGLAKERAVNPRAANRRRRM